LGGFYDGVLERDGDFVYQKRRIPHVSKGCGLVSDLKRWVRMLMSYLLRNFLSSQSPPQIIVSRGFCKSVVILYCRHVSFEVFKPTYNKLETVPSRLLQFSRISVLYHLVDLRLFIRSRVRQLKRSASSRELRLIMNNRSSTRLPERCIRL
jgi:hypothetical protein